MDFLTVIFRPSVRKMVPLPDDRDSPAELYKNDLSATSNPLQKSKLVQGDIHSLQGQLTMLQAPIECMSQTWLATLYPFLKAGKNRVEIHNYFGLKQRSDLLSYLIKVNLAAILPPK